MTVAQSRKAGAPEKSSALTWCRTPVQQSSLTDPDTRSGPA